MTVVQSLSSVPVAPSLWSMNWAWGLPLIALTVVFHVLGLGLIRRGVVRVFERTTHYHYQVPLFAVVLGGTTLLATMLHGVEAIIWAIAYRALNALPDVKLAILYSLNAITSYGHIELHLENHRHLMGALEALNGWLLFGLTAAFLFAVIQKFGFVESRGEDHKR
jgi:hypothetical protein